MQSILTVITPAESYDLTVLATVKAELGIIGTSEDVQIAKYIAQASGAIASYCNRVFAEETVTETFRNRSSGGTLRSIILQRSPVTEIDAVALDDVELVANTDYEFDGESGILSRICGGYRSTWSFRTLVVQYTAGYELVGTLPLPIERACISLTKQYRSSASRDPLVKGEEIPGVLKTDYWIGGVGANGALPPDVIDLVAPYRERTF